MDRWRLLTIAVLTIGGLVLGFLVWMEIAFWAEGGDYLRYHLARVALAIFALAALSFLLHRSLVLVVAAAMLFPLARQAPFDVTDLNYEGPPRLVPLVMGEPSWEDSLRRARGEVVLGGCVVYGNEPKWVLVW